MWNKWRKQFQVSMDWGNQEVPPKDITWRRTHSSNSFFSQCLNKAMQKIMRVWQFITIHLKLSLIRILHPLCTLSLRQPQKAKILGKEGISLCLSSPQPASPRPIWLMMTLNKLEHSQISLLNLSILRYQWTRSKLQGTILCKIMVLVQADLSVTRLGPWLTRILRVSMRLKGITSHFHLKSNLWSMLTLNQQSAKTITRTTLIN
jgi:hypothetical protein